MAIDTQFKKMRAEGIDVIGFSVGEPDFPTPEHIKQAGIRAIENNQTKYTPTPGTLDVRQAVSKRLKEDWGLDYSTDEIVVTGGGKPVLYGALKALLNPGDEVILPTPYWVSYYELIKMTGGVPVVVETTEEDGFNLTPEHLRAAITPKTKAIILNSPSNPNGCVYPRQELEAIAHLAVECGFYIISDEIYEKLIYDGEKHVCIASLGDDVKAQSIIVNGVSKTYAMTGWRIGYAAGPKNVIKAMTAFQSHASSNANSIAQYAAATALSCGDTYIKSMITEYDVRRKLMHRMLNEIDGLSCRLPKGAFYIMLNLQDVIGRSYKGTVIDGSSRFAELLLNEKRVAVVPALAFGDDNFARLSYATSRQNIVEGCKRIACFVGDLD